MKSSLIQPYFVMSNSKYYKSNIKNIGISHFYSFNKDNLSTCDMIAVPDGCIDILFNCNESSPKAEVCGSVLQSFPVIIEKKTTYFGVRFYPGQGYPFKNIALKEIINHQIPLNDILDANELIDQITSCQDFSQQVQFFMNHYIKNLHKSMALNEYMCLKTYMLNRIMESHGQIRIMDLANELGYSERYVNMKFMEFFGLSPKVFCKIIRFQHILNQLNNLPFDSEDTLLNIAIDAGYYDQSHMIKDFKQLSRNSPTKYLQQLKKADYKNRLILL